MNNDMDKLWLTQSAVVSEEIKRLISIYNAQKNIPRQYHFLKILNVLSSGKS